jgi:hypothetical protein
MNESYLKRQLAINRDRVAGLARGLAEEQLRWKPDQESWSILEVICHLADEEEFDFPVRLKFIIEETEKDWPVIDPQSWIEEHKYHKQELYPTLNRYMDLRNDSLVWLNSLKTPDWKKIRQTPFGEISAGDVYASWVAHDLLHLRQLVELHYGFLQQQSHPFSLDYAGEW